MDQSHFVILYVPMRFQWERVTWALLFIEFFRTAAGVQVVLAADEPPATPPKTLYRLPEQYRLKPNAPPELIKPHPEDYFSCHRQFTYKGQVMDCDSYQGADGDNLRPIIADVPSAVSELDRYQHNRDKIKFFAYTGSLGFLVAGAGWVAGRSMGGTRGIATANLAAAIGLSLIAGGLLGGLIILNQNEDHLYDAVKNYNTVKPNAPIELKITREFSL